MKKAIGLIVPLVAAMFLGGCSGGDQTVKDDAKMRESLTHPPKFDINNVPPESREIVRRMTQGKGGASSAPAVGWSGPAATSPAKPASPVTMSVLSRRIWRQLRAA